MYDIPVVVGIVILFSDKHLVFTTKPAPIGQSATRMNCILLEGRRRGKTIVEVVKEAAQA